MTTRAMISIAKDFSKVPAGRHLSDGPFTGQLFRERFLSEALKNNNEVVVNLDGTFGYGSSFLEEAFSGLVHVLGISVSDLKKRLSFESKEDPSLVPEIWSYIQMETPVCADCCKPIQGKVIDEMCETCHAWNNRFDHKD